MNRQDAEDAKEKERSFAVGVFGVLAACLLVASDPEASGHELDAHVAA